MNVLRIAILDFCRRKKGKSFYPSEIVRQMFPQDWELFVENLQEELAIMENENLIHLSWVGDQNSGGDATESAVIISEVGKPK
jgi:hypothetical protein